MSDDEIRETGGRSWRRWRWRLALAQSRPAAAQPSATVTRPISSGCRTRCTRRATTSRGCAAATRRSPIALQTELDDLRDEVDLPEGQAAQGRHRQPRDYTDVRDRLQTIRSRSARRVARRLEQRTGAATRIDRVGSGIGGGAGGTGTAARRAASTAARRPAARDRAARSRHAATNSGRAGDRRPARRRELSSDTAQVEDRFEATTVVDLYQGNDVLIPAGSMLRGVVSSVNKATRTDRKGSLTVAFDQVTVRGRNYPIRGTVTAGARERRHQG